MAVTKLYFVRHGLADNNLNESFNGGFTESNLNSEGKKNIR
ncbi:hypothetical protein IGI37_001017 [Enterococcus sp. AZ194]